MSVSSPFILRPIATSLLGVAVMLGGLLGYLWLPVSSLPQVDFPTIQVTTQLPGASPDVMASLVTAPLERNFGQIPALQLMTSSSSFGVSQITLQFDLNRDIDAAAQDVQAAINASGSTLPRNLPYPPVYSKVNPADAPMVTLAITSDTISLRALSDIADTLLAQRLSELTGVGRVTVQGNIRPAIRVQADLSRLANYGIALEDLRNVILAANVAGPKGSLDGAHQSYTIASIRASVRDVQFTLILSVALVITVVLIFLRTVRATIIAGVALPLSIIATFGVMWFCGFSLDNLSLMALTIGTGFVVDDAIVMIENIVRHMENGEGPFQAALRGASEIGFTIISLTFSLIAVFIPLLFMTGLVGRMFREFALTLTIAVVTSAVVSLTLTPMMCSRLLRHQPAGAVRGGITRIFHRAVDGSVELYRRTLEWVLRHETLTLLVTGATLIATIWLYIIIPKGFLPLQDTGLIFAVMEGGQDISFTEMKRLQATVENAIRKDPDVTGVVSVIGVTPINATPNAGRLAITLRSREERPTLVTGIIERLQRAVAAVPGVVVYFRPVQDIQISTRLSRGQYQYTLTGTDAKELDDWAARLTQQLQKSDVLRDVASEAQDYGLGLDIQVDREVAGRLGVSMQTVIDTLSDAFGQRQISTIYGQANQYRVVLEAKPEYQNDPTSLSKLYVPASGVQAVAQPTSLTSASPTVIPTVSGAAMVPLSAIGRYQHTTAPLVVAHQEQFPAVTISFNLAPGAALSDAVSTVSQAEHEIGMPTSVTGSYSGDAAEFGKSLAGEPWLILAAAVTIYIVLGVLYESFIHPLTILSTLPSAGVGALLALMLYKQDLSVVALIGIALLMGIVKKNAIMMIDFALEAERKEGLSPRDSIVKASMLRFRPIMMTTLAALFGASPLAFESGTGSELRNPLGITIIGGLLLSQLLTLYTTPVVYLAMERVKRRLSRPAPLQTEFDLPDAPEPSQHVPAE